MNAVCCHYLVGDDFDHTCSRQYPPPTGMNGWIHVGLSIKQVVMLGSCVAQGKTNAHRVLRKRP